MPRKTPEQYQASLRDGRTVYLRDQRVEDVTAQPDIGVMVDHACIDAGYSESA